MTPYKCPRSYRRPATSPLEITSRALTLPIHLREWSGESDPGMRKQLEVTNEIAEDEDFVK